MKKRQADFVRKYMRELRHALPINYPNQKKILHSIKQNLINYINENPYSDYSNLTNEFGTPLDTAISFMNEMPEETFSESLKKRKKIFLISIILLIICTATIITYFNYLAATTPIYIDQVTYIYNDTEISYSTEILDTELKSFPYTERNISKLYHLRR